MKIRLTAEKIKYLGGAKRFPTTGHREIVRASVRSGVARLGGMSHIAKSSTSCGLLEDKNQIR